MDYCAKCGKEIAEGSSFCQHCGEKLSILQSSIQNSPTSVVTDKDFCTFIGKNTDKYLAKYEKFNVNGVDRFKATWHWPAFFVPFFWLLYRKLYLWALLVFVLGIIPFVGFFAMIVFGITGNYIYYKRAKKKILELKGLYSSSDVQQAIEMARAGGVNHVAVVLAPILIFVVVGTLAAISIPTFLGYRQRAFDAQAQADIKNACTIAHSILFENPDKMITLRDLEEKGLRLSPGIELRINDGAQESLNIVARHTKSKKLYIADKNCSITEEIQP